MPEFLLAGRPHLQYMVPPDLPPSSEYWFGTNSRGQDLFWQATFAIRNTLLFGLLVAFLSRIISITVGLIAGYTGGWFDRALMSINDVVVALPIFPILVLFYYVFRNDLTTLTLALIMACFGWPFDARLIRSVALGLRNREFTHHAVFAGMSARKIMFEEHLPFVLPIVFSTAMANMIWSIGLATTLAVLGFTNLNIPSIGTMLYWANSHSAMVVGTWWWILVPVVLVVITFVGSVSARRVAERIHRSTLTSTTDGWRMTANRRRSDRREPQGLLPDEVLRCRP